VVREVLVVEATVQAVVAAQVQLEQISIVMQVDVAMVVRVSEHFLHGFP
jgi:hypothetical protein